MGKYNYDNDRTNIPNIILLFTLHMKINGPNHYTYLRELSPDQTKWFAIKDSPRRCLNSDHTHVVKKCCDFVVRIVKNPKLAHLEGNPFHAAGQKVKHSFIRTFIQLSIHLSIHSFNYKEHNICAQVVKNRSKGYIIHYILKKNKNFYTRIKEGTWLQTIS